MPRHNTVVSLPLVGEENKFIDVSVFYDEGGANYFSGNTSERGFYVSAKPVERDGNFTKMDLFSGLKQLLLPARRFSQKKFDALSEAAKNPEVYTLLVQRVCEHEGLTLA